MTTIAYCHKQKRIAYDSRASANEVICTDNFNKHFILNEENYFISGFPSDIACYLSAIKNNDLKFTPNITAFKVGKNKNVYRCFVQNTDRGYIEDFIDYNLAIGSGKHFAIAVLDMKQCAKEAVKYAKTRDVYTGGRVRVFDIKTMKHV